MDSVQIDRYLDAIWVERGLSQNTLAAYRSDLFTITRWLDREKKISLLNCTSVDLRDYLAIRFADGSSGRSVARLLSALRGFYVYLIRERVVETNPAALIESPFAGRPLPKTLTELDVDKLIAAPDTNRLLFCRFP